MQCYLDLRWLALKMVVRWCGVKKVLSGGDNRIFRANLANFQKKNCRFLRKKGQKLSINRFELIKNIAWVDKKIAYERMHTIDQNKQKQALKECESILYCSLKFYSRQQVLTQKYLKRNNLGLNFTFTLNEPSIQFSSYQKRFLQSVSRTRTTTTYKLLDCDARSKKSWKVRN